MGGLCLCFGILTGPIGSLQPLSKALAEKQRQ
ncbi:hypothetical protein SY94_2560 [Agrobacterium tumefaciens]|nr:hypothetical protein SY94_2560 [Agrobacterium tumefaciens]